MHIRLKDRADISLLKVAPIGSRLNRLIDTVPIASVVGVGLSNYLQPIFSV